MSDNPFLSNTYQSIWRKHFAAHSSVYHFSFTKSFGFTKHSYLPVYYNTGGVQTKGINYNVSQYLEEDYKNKIFIVFDIPSFISEKNNPDSSSLSLKYSRQYAGFLCDFTGYKDSEDYIKQTLSKKSWAKLRNRLRVLEQTFSIRYQMYQSDITQEEFHFLFKEFKLLLHKRFTDKKTVNINLNDQEWPFYEEVVFNMMQEDKAALFVTYDKNHPIAFALLLKEGPIVYDTIRVFDIAYAKYQVGTTSIKHLIDWCFVNNIEKLDFSKGYFEYKERWCNTPYHFNYHIWYDNNSLWIRFLALLIIKGYNLKQWLRQFHVNDLYYRLKYSIVPVHTQKVL